VPDWITYSSTVLTVLGVIVTAIATTLLWRVTDTLAVHTKRMADAQGRPQVVATLEANRWAMNHADIQVENTGTGTAYDIEVAFKPALSTLIGGDAVPLERLSVLKPNQRFSSYLSEFVPLLRQRFEVTVSWRCTPTGEDREALSYVLNMQDVATVSRLGPSDPATELAEQVKKIREDWRAVASGSQHIKADVYSSGDRLHERRQLERWRQSRDHNRNGDAPTTPRET
jgi:hypothetical protein